MNNKVFSASSSSGPRISAKNLGLLLLPYFCACCFWLEMKLWKKQVPFRFPPARLIGSLDRFQKKMIEDYFKNNDGKFPAWLGEFAEAYDYRDDIKKLRLVDEPTGLTITGIPDFIFEFHDETYGVLDFKTAPYADGNDKLKPMYNVQVNAYAYLLQEIEGKTVSKAGFAYFEGDTGQLGCVPHEMVTDSGHNLPFKVTVEMLKLNPDRIVQKLLDKVEEIYSMDEPPAPKSNCPNCVLLADYVELVTGKRPRLREVKSDQVLEDSESGVIVPGVMELWDSSEE